MSKTDTLSRGQRTRLELLRSAERLLGREGWNASSLRRIAEEAGQQNPSVVHYYFNSRDGLIAAIFDDRAAEMEPIRVEMLDLVIVENKIHDTGALMRVMMEPHMALRAEDGSFPFSEFLLEYLIRFPGEDKSVHTTFRAPEKVAALNRARDLMLARLEHLPDHVRQLRFRSSLAMILHSLIVTARQTEDMEQIRSAVDDAIEMATAALLAPPAPVRIR